MVFPLHAMNPGTSSGVRACVYMCVYLASSCGACAVCFCSIQHWTRALDIISISISFPILSLSSSSALRSLSLSPSLPLSSLVYGTLREWLKYTVNTRLLSAPRLACLPFPFLFALAFPACTPPLRLCPVKFSPAKTEREGFPACFPPLFPAPSLPTHAYHITHTHALTHSLGGSLFFFVEF